METWRTLKEKFVEEGGTTFVDLLRYHPRTLVSNVQKRREFFDTGYYSVECKGNKVVLYLNPRRGKRVRMPVESFDTLSMVASDVASEYEAPGLQSNFLEALEDFVNSRSSRTLVFKRDGNTKIV